MSDGNDLNNNGGNTRVKNQKRNGDEVDVFSVPSSDSDNNDNEKDNDENAVRVEVTPRKRSQRRNRNEVQVESKGEKNTSPPTNSDPDPELGRRSSGRQRKAPKRYEDEQLNSPSRRRGTTAAQVQGQAQGQAQVSTSTSTSTSNEGEGRRVSRSSRLRDTRRVSEMDKDDDDKPGRTRKGVNFLKKSARGDSDNVGESIESTAGEEQQQRQQQRSTENDDQDIDLNDLVSMQLQQNLIQHDADGGGEGREEEDSDEIVRAGPLPDYAEHFQNLYQEGLGAETRLLIGTILEKLTGKRHIPLKGLENEYQKVHQLIEQTVTAGEGNSMLIFGSRGSGKSAVVERVISSLAEQHKDDFHVVRLNGFLQTDDRLALREIWRQLGRETDTEDEVAKVSSYADTMATLLALLSHPEEVFGDISGNNDSTRTAKSIVIILDEFDLFVSHPRQTLLYNLFDIAQARKAPIAVIGLTTRVDVTEVLEKRVKSRFSHRYTYLPNPRSFGAFSDICFAGLNLEDGEFGKVVDSEDKVVKSARWNKLVEGWRSYLKVCLFTFFLFLVDVLHFLVTYK